jgi:hypothetical protein
MWEASRFSYAASVQASFYWVKPHGILICALDDQPRKSVALNAECRCEFAQLPNVMVLDQSVAEAAVTYSVSRSSKSVTSTVLGGGTG